MEKVNLTDKLKLIHEHWNPHIAGELNGQYVKLAKLKGEFVWHKHEQEDELFLVIKGQLTMHFRDKTVLINPNEFIIVPKGVEHKPEAQNEVEILLFEPMSTLNTGDVSNEMTRSDLKRI